VDAAYYTFPELGIGTAPDGLSVLTVQWISEEGAAHLTEFESSDVDKENLPAAGWTWLKDGAAYPTLEAALAGGSLYTASPITYTVTQSGGTSGAAETTALVFAFSSGVDLTVDDITLAGDNQLDPGNTIGSAMIDSTAPLAGGSAAWTLTIAAHEEGTIQASITKFGIDGANHAVEVFAPIKNQASADYWADTAIWMSHIRDGADIRDLAIPGTHDTATYAIPVNLAGYLVTQNLNIRHQLDGGIRFLDLRADSDGELNHGGFVCYQNWSTRDIYELGEAIDDIVGFLDAHPTETVLVSVQDEYTTNSAKFQLLIQSVIDAHPGRWYTGTSIPVLGEVRGKMVLLDRSGWVTTFGIQRSSVEEQNEWNNGSDGQTGFVRCDAKFDIIEEFLKKTQRGGQPSDKLLLNWWNHQANAPYTIDIYADDINKWMPNYWNNTTTGD